MVFGSRSRTSPSRFSFGAETDFRPALSEFAESPRGCQRRFGLLSLVRARFGLPGGRAGRQEATTGRLRWLFGRSEGLVDNVFLFHGGQVVVDRLVDAVFARKPACRSRGSIKLICQKWCVDLNGRILELLNQFRTRRSAYFSRPRACLKYRGHCVPQILVMIQEALRVAAPLKDKTLGVVAVEVQLGTAKSRCL